MQVGQDQLPWISPLCMGILAISSSVAALALPDTKSITLLATVDDAEVYYRENETILSKILSKKSICKNENQ